MLFGWLPDSLSMLLLQTNIWRGKVDMKLLIRRLFVYALVQLLMWQDIAAQSKYNRISCQFPVPGWKHSPLKSCSIVLVDLRLIPYTKVPLIHSHCVPHFKTQMKDRQQKWTKCKCSDNTLSKCILPNINDVTRWPIPCSTDVAAIRLLSTTTNSVKCFLSKTSQVRTLCNHLQNAK